MSSPKCRVLYHSSAYRGNHRIHIKYSVCAYSGGLQKYLMIKQKQTADVQTQYLFDSFCLLIQSTDCFVILCFVPPEEIQTDVLLEAAHLEQLLML